MDTNSQEVAHALRMCRQHEQDTIQLYQLLLDFVNDIKIQSQIVEFIREEEKHLQQIEIVLNRLVGAPITVETTMVENYPAIEAELQGMATPELFSLLMGHEKLSRDFYQELLDRNSDHIEVSGLFQRLYEEETQHLNRLENLANLFQI